MRVREFAHGIDLACNAPDFVRSPGLHISDVYNSLYKAIDPKRYDKRDEDGAPEELHRAKIGAGTAFELHFETQLRAKYGGMRPGEFFTQHAESCTAYRRPVRDGTVLCGCGAGIAYSPDWLFDHAPILGEFKFTWYSCRDFPFLDKFDKWRCQVQVYLYHLKMATVWVFPFWVNGTYPRGAPSPLFESAYELTFSEAEIQTTWRAVLRHAKKEGMIP